jgi:hypothetical protein
MDHHQQTRSAQRSRASLIVLIVLAFLLMTAAIVLVFSLPDNSALQLPTETSSLVAADTGFTCDDSEAQRMYPFGSDVVKLDTNRIACLDITGKEKFAADTEMSAPAAVWNDEFFLAADRGGYSFILLDADGVRCQGTAAGRISSASISPDGHFALIIDESGGSGIISLYEPENGKRLFDCYNPESGYPLSVAFPADGSFFDVSLVNTSGSVMQPVVKRYGMDGAQKGQRLPDLSELLPMIVYDQQGTLVLYGSSTLAALTYEKDELVWQARYHQIFGIRPCKDGLLVLATEKTDGQCSLICLKADGSQRFNLPAGDLPGALEVRGNLAATFCGTRLIAVDAGQGKVILDTDIASEIIRIGFAGPRSLTIISRGGVRRLNIPE